MNTSDERGHARGNATGAVLCAVDEALHDVLLDLRRARTLLEEQPTRSGDDQAEALRCLLHAVEGNLLDTVIGLRLVCQHKEGASTLGAKRPAQANTLTGPLETPPNGQGRDS